MSVLGLDYNGCKQGCLWGGPPKGLRTPGMTTLVARVGNREGGASEEVGVFEVQLGGC
jgi:hypothetical protein